MAAQKTRKPTGEEAGKKKKAQKVDEPKKPAPAKKHASAKRPAPAKQSKPMKEKTSKAGKVMKVHKGKRPDHLVDKDYEEVQPNLVPQVDEDELNLQRGIQMSLEAFETQGQARQAPVG
ncbi:hypothetical protein Tco_0434188, partial [Tanacetum coccineum]